MYLIEFMNAMSSSRGRQQLWSVLFNSNFIYVTYRFLEKNNIHRHIIIYYDITMTSVKLIHNGLHINQH